MISANNVTYRVGKKALFEDVNIKFTEGNCYGLIGANEDGEVQYMQDGQVVSHKGIDVSKHQGNIDWTKVAADGVEFAFIRVGLRGYGTEGKLVEDEYFEQNIKGALQAGIKVGVYFYSQAITDAELLEEANLVLEKVKPYNKIGRASCRERV